MLPSVLIANRGEIACRIARTARRLGMRTIAVYSEADAASPHVRICDEAHAIGAAPAAESYLAIERILEAARKSGAACIHPGYGFLSERPEFAQACAQAGIVFVGPSPEAIRAMGLKDQAKILMEKSGVPVVPGYHGEQQDPNLLKRKAYEIGYPVLIKAVAGGGGKGMRRVDRHMDFDDALQSARREAGAAFGDDRVLIEKYIASPRHIEFQVLGDQFGKAIHLGERDCSLQRRHQKVIEEAPAPGMSGQVRAAMGRAAVKAAQAVKYAGAGTVEFIADASSGLKPDAFWFMEMNTRLQVEHPVTEAVTGLDLVEWQFRVAAGEAVPFDQESINLTGHAVEARVYAEDPEKGFLPSTGKLVALQFPADDGIRIDSGVEAGQEITPFYDPMIAKVIAHAPTRDEALERLAETLDDTLIAGPRSNVPFLSAICRAPAFREGKFDTSFIDRNLQALGAVGRDVDGAAAASGVAHLLAIETARLEESAEPESPWSPWQARDGFQLSGERVTYRALVVDGQSVTAAIRYGPEGPAVKVGDEAPDLSATIVPVENGVYVLRGGRQSFVRWQPIDFSVAHGGAADNVVRAPMHGKVLEILVSAGASIAKGHRVAVIEAMKMEHAILAPHDGTVTEVAVAPGEQVPERGKICVIEASAAESH